jgi:hypothetical protein
LYSCTGATGNVAVGYGSLQNNLASNNTATGFQSSYSNTTGTNNVSYGPQALYSNTSGSQNVAMGYNAGFNNTTGINNTFIGYNAGAVAPAGCTGFTCIGANSGTGSDPVGNSRILLGSRAGQETVYLNQIAPMYTTVPTFTSENVGGIIGATSYTPQTNLSSGNIASFTNVPLGVYLCTGSIYASLVSGNPQGNIIVATSQIVDTGVLQQLTVDFWTSTGINATNLFPTIPFTNNTANNTIYINFKVSSGSVTVQPQTFFLTRIA